MQCRYGQAGRVEHERNSIFLLLYIFLLFALTVRWRPRIYPYPTAGSACPFSLLSLLSWQTDTVRVVANVPHRLNPCVPPPPSPPSPSFLLHGHYRGVSPSDPDCCFFFLYLPVSDRSWECGRKDAASFRVLLCESVRHNCRSKK